MDNRTEVREFLASRRARISPDEAGVVSIGGRRRVEGLRREEVARLAGVSVDYYTRLERGNLTGASETILMAIASALSLDRAEQDHLFDLARAANATMRVTTTRVTRAKAAAGVAVPASVEYLLQSITEAPAIIGNNRMDIVAANPLGYALYSEMYRGTIRPANHSRFIFLDPRAADFYPDWDRAANVNVAILRRDAGRNPHDRGIAELVGELSMRSDEFRTRWAAHNVRRHYSGMKSFQHSAVGLLELTFQGLELEDVPGHTLTVYPAVPGSAAEQGLKLLATWAATENIVDRANRSTPVR